MDRHQTGMAEEFWNRDSWVAGTGAVMAHRTSQPILPVGLSGPENLAGEHRPPKY